MSHSVQPWDPTGPLPTGDAALLEASAGTGKTWQTEGLVVRLVAEGLATIDQVLVITFTRAATAELRARVRQRLGRARRALEGVQAAPDDPVITHLCAGGADERAVRLERVQRALADYDQATVSTIHSFCQEMLQVYAFAAGQDPLGQEQGAERLLAERLVADLLGAVLLRVGIDELGLLRSTGWTAGVLGGLAELAGKAHLGEVVPPPGPLDGRDVATLADQLAEATRAWLDRRQRAAGAFLSWLDSAPGQAAVAALPPATGGEKISGFTGFSKHDSPWAVIRAWLRVAGAPGPAASLWDLLRRLPDLWAGTAANKKSGRRFADTPLAPLAAQVAALDAVLADQPPVLPAALLLFRHLHQVERRARGLQTFASMLSDLAEALVAEEGRAAQPLRDAIRSRYRVALVDEFQDTDEAQWAIVRRVFLDSPDHRLYLVGDPKQAIYRFRGANVGVYQAARAQVLATGGRLARLAVNHRSDPGVVQATNQLWGDGAAFDLAGLGYEPVGSARPTRLSGAGAPFELRWLTGTACGASPSASYSKAAGTDGACRAAARRIAALLADETVRLEGRRLLPSDFAVLCRSHAQAAQVEVELARWGIFAVRRDDSRVYGAPAADWLLAWLEAVAAPDVEAGVMRLALTPLVGWSAGSLEQARSEAAPAWSALRRAVLDAAEAWARGGLAAAFPRFAQAHGSFARVLASAHGERGATDLQALFDLCDLEQRRARLGPSGLADQLRARMGEQGEEEEATRVVESDRDAVTLSTIHASKGLQYGIVLVPACWYGFGESDGHKAVRYSRLDGDRVERVLDLHPKGSAVRRAAVDRADAESKQEDMRLLYVALTRARHKVIAWGVNYKHMAAGPLGRLLGLDRDAFSDDDLPALSDLGPGLGQVVAEPLLGVPVPVGGGPTVHAVPFQPWRLPHEPGAGWQVASYSSLGRSQGVDLDEPQRSEPESDPVEVGPEVDAAPVQEPVLQRPADPALLEPAAGHAFRGGTAAGTWLHAVLEELDFQGSPLRARDGRDLDALVGDAGRAHGVTDPGQHALVIEQVGGWLHTPLDGPGLVGMPPGFRLRDLGAGDRLDELQFHLRLGDGHGRQAPGGQLNRLSGDGVREALAHAAETEGFGGRAWVAALLARTRVGEDGSVAPAPVLPAISGFLQGFVDLLFRVDGRYFVCDYKTNQLAGTTAMIEQAAAWGPAPGQPEAPPPRLRRVHYGRPVMAWAMAHSAYHLQALLYTVALHRLLEQRLPGYDYERHVGGHLYLFLRGMEGAATPRVGGACLGVWTDRWPEATVVGLSRALGGDR